MTDGFKGGQGRSAGDAVSDTLAWMAAMVIVIGLAVAINVLASVLA